MENLKKILSDIIGEVDGNVSVYIKDASSGRICEVNSERVYHAASIIKISLMYEALLQIQRGQLSFNDKYTLSGGDIVGGCGVLQLMTPGTVFSVKDLITLMIAVSDNTATNILHDILKKDNVNISLRQLGLDNTKFARKLMISDSSGSYSYTTACDTAKLLSEFLECRYLSREYADIGIEILYKQQYNDRIPFDLILCSVCGEIIGQNNICPSCGAKTWAEDPKEVLFAHKTGEINATRHDAGILNINGKNVIIVCLTDRLKNNDEASNMQRELGRTVYKYFLKNLN